MRVEHLGREKKLDKKLETCYRYLYESHEKSVNDPLF